MLPRVRSALALVLVPLLFLPGLLGAANPAPKPPPTTPSELTVEDFFRPPAITKVRLNPAGSRMALTVFEEKADSTGLRIFDFATGKTTGMRGSTIYDLSDFRWVGDDHIVFSVVRENMYASGLLVAQVGQLDRPRIIDRHDVVETLSTPIARPNHLLLWIRMSAQDSGRPGPLVEIDVTRRYDSPFGDPSSRITPLTLQPSAVDSVLAWLSDRAGEIRYALGHTKGKVRLFRREPADKWTEVNIDLDRLTPLAVDIDPNVLFVARLASDGARELVRWNTADGTTGPVLYRDDKYDFGQGGILFSGDERQVLGLNYAKQAPVQIALHDEETALQRTVDSLLPENRVNLIVNRSRDHARLIVRSSSDRHPGTIYVVEPKAQNVSKVGDLAPWLPENLLGPVKVTTYTARDGLRLDAYVTVPANYEAGKRYPMIVLPHGGPWVRDSWGYDPGSQFFASRGYVVFRPNYRGSSGYNEEISLKPRMEFRKMHDDVTDGVRALIKAGIADPGRIAIVGGSFGGYLAVCGAAFEPDMYKCAVTIAGIFDWERVIKESGRNDPDSYRRDRLLRDLGDPKAQQQKFEAMSPIKAAGQIKIPVFIAHGEDDRVADSSQSHRLAKALAKTGVPVETMFASYEGHGFAALKNRVELYQRIESFLKKNL